MVKERHRVTSPETGCRQRFWARTRGVRGTGEGLGGRGAGVEAGARGRIVREKRLTDLGIGPPNGSGGGGALGGEGEQFGQTFALAEDPIPHGGAIAGAWRLDGGAGVGARFEVEVEAADAGSMIEFRRVGMVERRLETCQQQAGDDGGVEYHTHLS